MARLPVAGESGSVIESAATATRETSGPRSSACLVAVPLQNRWIAVTQLLDCRERESRAIRTVVCCGREDPPSSYHLQS